MHIEKCLTSCFFRFFKVTSSNSPRFFRIGLPFGGESLKTLLQIISNNLIISAAGYVSMDLVPQPKRVSLVVYNAAAMAQKYKHFVKSHDHSKHFVTVSFITAEARRAIILNSYLKRSTIYSEQIHVVS